MKKFMARNGSRGGKKSRRKLTPEHARKMVAVREAQKAYDRHRHQYFWSYRDGAKITYEDIDWVTQGMMNEGNRAAFEEARRIRRLIREN